MMTAITLTHHLLWELWKLKYDTFDGGAEGRQRSKDQILRGFIKKRKQKFQRAGLGASKLSLHQKHDNHHQSNTMPEKGNNQVKKHDHYSNLEEKDTFLCIFVILSFSSSLSENPSEQVVISELANSFSVSPIIAKIQFFLKFLEFALTILVKWFLGVLNNIVLFPPQNERDLECRVIFQIVYLYDDNYK